MLHYVGVLFVLVIWPVRFNDTIDSVDGAGDSVIRNKPSKITADISSICSARIYANDLPIQEVHGNTKITRHAVQPHHAVTLEELLIGPESHLTYKPSPVLVQITVLSQEMVLDSSKREKE